MVQAIVHEGSPRGKSETMGVKILFYALPLRSYFFRVWAGVPNVGMMNVANTRNADQA